MRKPCKTLAKFTCYGKNSLCSTGIQWTQLLFIQSKGHKGTTMFWTDMWWSGRTKHNIPCGGSVPRTCLLDYTVESTNTVITCIRVVIGLICPRTCLALEYGVSWRQKNTFAVLFSDWYKAVFSELISVVFCVLWKLHFLFDEFVKIHFLKLQQRFSIFLFSTEISLVPFLLHVKRESLDLWLWSFRCVYTDKNPVENLPLPVFCAFVNATATRRNRAKNKFILMLECHKPMTSEMFTAIGILDEVAIGC